ATGPYRSCRAMLEMISHQLLPHPAQCLLNGRDLGEDVSALAIVVHHLLQPANLALDATKSRQVPCFQLGIDGKRFSRARRGIANCTSALSVRGGDFSRSDFCR